jgi:hypothetical protein
LLAPGGDLTGQGGDPGLGCAVEFLAGAVVAGQRGRTPP